ncbi:MAG: hypothetical protein HY923_07605 [Elusimicrobia bacterium]|nr:hypothetical protein [Elusimicrobiota bacterium]
MDHSTEYRAGLERAMDALKKEKQKHSVIAPAYFALVKVYDELREELETREKT